MEPYVHPTACVDPGAVLGPGVRVWHFCHVMAGAVLGANTSLGQNVFVAAGVRLGAGVKVQNNVSLFAGVEVEDDVFLGPSCVLTNVVNPRAAVSRKGCFGRILLRRGATLGANCTVVCGRAGGPARVVGRHAFVAAGAVLAHDAPDYGLILGVPGRLAGYMSRHGHRLQAAPGVQTCPESGLRYELAGGVMRCLDEDTPLP